MQETMETNLLTDSLRRPPESDIQVCYNRIPKSETEHQEREKSIVKWQKQWDNFTKGSVTREFFPNIQGRFHPFTGHEGP